MRTLSLLLLCCVCLPLAAGADTPAPVHVVIGKPLTPITDVLASLAKQTGQTILSDDTAVAPVDVADLQAPTLDAMLDSLKSLDAGLTWQKVYLPKDASLPSGNDLSAQVRALKTVAASGLVIADAAGTVSFSRRKPNSQAAAPADMRLVYLVTDEAVRAQRLTAKQADARPADVPQPVSPAASIQNAAAAFSQMTPDEQRQALPLMFQQFRAMMQGMDPSVRAGLRQQFGGRRGGLNGPGNGQ